METFVNNGFEEMEIFMGNLLFSLVIVIIELNKEFLSELRLPITD